MKKKLLATVGAVLGLSLLLTINAPTSTKADSNLLLASVEWVQAQLSPLQTKVTSLEKQLAAQDATIKQLQKAVAEGGNVVVTPPTTEPSTETPAVVYTTTSAKVHSGATRNYKVLSTIAANKGLTVIGQHKGADGVWYRVEVSSTVKGWIFSNDVSTTKPSEFIPSKVVTKQATNVRKGATTNYKSLETVAKGSTLTYLGSFKNANGETWYNVQTPKGTKGWVLSTLTEVK
ncbi:SH3 domain-containing protein [Psychrobacillus psychrodurans]|uniref:SH3 domain-containing protein n=1 Tax=Psychrobacillus psychrodurans TaxID=126157 RepID=A0A9X3L5N3_9BACI|nr:SH3 domain-containing protein [Psychrobacillus psychrodurans]MCZ8531851.1 SH3 domain-containing protein [Psychrobacillus psychrodurans]